MVSIEYFFVFVLQWLHFIDIYCYGTSLFNEKFCIAENVQEPLILNYHFIATLQLRKPFIFNLDVGTGYLLLQVPLKNKQKTGKKNLNCMSQTAQAV